MNEALRTVARLEFVNVGRHRWIQSFAAVFAALTVATAWGAGSARDLYAPDGFARTTVALVPLILLVVPLVSMLVALSGQAEDEGTETYLYAMPVARSAILFGRWLGEATALIVALLVGLGAGGAIVATSAGFADVASFAVVVAGTVALSLAFLSIGTCIAAMVPKRAVALAIGALAWFGFVLLFDALALTLGAWLPGRTGARVLMWSVFLNPADLMRVVVLSLGGTPHLLGAAGDAWTLLLGGPVGATAASIAALFMWIALPLAAARQMLYRRDL
jgi:Cu-processing system permease protein